jgi:pSer/pThr/pTyr-binding forkhead associated (FHA) protein
MPQAMLKTEKLGFVALIDDNGTESLQFPLHHGENRIGGGEDCQLRFPEDGFLAGVHCVLEADLSKVILRPLDQVNGTYLRISAPIELKHGDVIRVGQEVLRFERMDRLVPELNALGLAEAVGVPLPRGVWGRLSQLHLTRQVANAYLLSTPDVFLGRERGDILFPRDGFVSGSHAVLSDRGGRAFLKDLGSSNGTFVRLKQEVPLRSGDLFLLGRNLLRIHLNAAA